MKEKFLEAKSHLEETCELIIDSSNRIVFKDDNKAYKLAKNMLGLDSNREELRLSSKEEAFINMESYIDDLVICTDLIDASKENTVMNHLKVSLRFIEWVLTHAYFSHNDRYLRRGLTKEMIDQNYLGPVSSFGIEILQELNDIAIKHSVEPLDLIHGSFVIGGKLKIIDFGLTEKNYLRNMRRICLRAPNTQMDTFVLRDFEGNFIPSLESYTEDNLTLDEIIENRFGIKKINYEDDKIYRNNILLLERKTNYKNYVLANE